jgi:predicted phage terminase large subunit-like protein
MYVLDADLERRHPDRIIQDVLEKARWLRREFGAQYTAFGAETNQFQWFLKERLAAESAAAGIYLPLVEVRAASDKVLRIQSLQPDIRNGYLLFSRDQTELLRQLEQFPLGRHDDGPDALEGAVRLCKQGPRLGTMFLRM